MLPEVPFSRAFLFFGGAVLLPFLFFSCLTCKKSSGPSRSLGVVLSQYVGKFPLMVCLYHIVLTMLISAYCAQEVTEKMIVAVDLNYYTKTTIRATEAYDAIQDGKYQHSYYNWFFHGSGRRRLDEFKDLIAIYHASDSWDNMLTPEGISDMCLAEKMFVASQSCIGTDDVSSILDSLMDDNCTLKQPFDETLLAFGLEENAQYVEDNIDPSSPESSIVLSYYATSCNLKLDSVDTSVSEVENAFSSTTHMAYAHTDLVKDAFVAAGLNDVKLSLIAMVVCFAILSLSIGLKFLYGLLFMICIFFSLAVGAGCLPLFGFSSFSAFNVLAIFVITGVGADAIIVFCSAWYKCFANIKIEALSFCQDIDSEDLLRSVDMKPYLPLVLYSSYSLVVTALTFTVMTTVLSFLANLVSPIVVIAQLGAFMGTAMTTYFILLHLILIPAWVFVVKMDQYVSLCSPCLALTSLCCKSFHKTQSSTSEFESEEVRIRGCEFETASQISRIAGCESEDVSVVLGFENMENDDDVSRNDNRTEGIVSMPMEVGDEEQDLCDVDEEEIQFPVVRRKQNLCWGCSVFIIVIAAMFAVLYGVNVVIDTDFGLPMLFKEGTNMADLMYITKNHKSDILTLSNTGGSSNSPNPGTSNPTSEPTHAPTLSPTVLTDSPTQFPTSQPTPQPSTIPTTFPTQSPTYVPTVLPTTCPTSVPTTLPTTPQPTLSPVQYPTGVPSPSPSYVPTSPSSIPSSCPSSIPTLTTCPTFSPSYSRPPSKIPTSTPSSSPSSSCPSSTPSMIPTSFPSSTPSGIPSSAPSGIPTSMPSSLPTSIPSSSPSSTPSTATPTISPSTQTLSPSTQAELAADGNTVYTVYVCYGIDIEKNSVDSEPKASVNHETFDRYAAGGDLLSDIQSLCKYLENNKIYMEVAMLNSECLYDQLMAVTADDDDSEISIFERIGLWMSLNKDNMFQVGVEETGEGVVSGNFGEELDLWLTWICQPILCRADVSSFFNDPEHALTMVERWDNAMYNVGSDFADNHGVVSLTGSEAWLFPLLSDRIVSSIYVSASISFMGCLFLITIATRNLKLSLLIGLGMLFVMITSLLLHALFFSSTIDLIDVIVVISFVGIIIDYPTHMAFHYEQDLRQRKLRSTEDVRGSIQGYSAQDEEDSFHRNSFSYMRVALIGPAVTTICAALPLMFAEFSIISKAGEYVLIMCTCTYLYVAFVMPSILRCVGEITFFPCRFSIKNRVYFEASQK